MSFSLESDSWRSLADDELNMFIDALDNYGSSSDSDLSNEMISTPAARSSVLFHDTVQELSASGNITESPLKDASFYARGTLLQNFLASLQNLEAQTMNNIHHQSNHDENDNSGSLTSLILFEEEAETAAASDPSIDILDRARDEVVNALTNDDDDDDNNNNTRACNEAEEHSASQSQQPSKITLARYEGLTPQYVCLFVCDSQTGYYIFF
jgi:hypothetical protein